MLVERMIRAARLDVSLYEEVEADTTATSQAATVVLIVAVANIIAAVILIGAASSILPAGVPRPSLIGLIIGGLIRPFISWIIFAYVTYFVGTNLFNGTATPGELLRTMGFAQTPGVLGILGFIPCINVIVALVVLVWVLVAAVIAIRQALDIDTGKAIVTGIISFVIVLVISIVLGFLGLAAANV